jgi:phosphoenolpyruvate synthase/pyruvate phosphate dikinase
MKDEYILSLSDAGATLETIGGKGVSLARLAGAGLPVPGGYHITTEAYRRFVQENDLQAAISQALELVDVSDPSTLEVASKTITSLFNTAPIPGDIASEIVQAYATLPGVNPAVAVRSSATAEDLPEASFAGQQETYLNVAGADAVLDATRKCWASLWTARAIGYRARQEINSDGVALAVVVQLLVPAEAAGILFTANPMDGNRDQILINASWGLGEAVVGGGVTPDTLTLDKAGQVISRDTAEKLVQTVRVNGGTQEQATPKNLRLVPVLSDEQATELGQLGLRIEELYNMPMDIEWALADGEFAIVQARPITALPAPVISPPSEWPMPDPNGRYMRTSIVDLLPDPLSPLFATMGLAAINRGIDEMSIEFLNMPEGSSLSIMLTINGYAYQSAGFSNREWWLLLTRMLPAIPRMLRKGVSYWQDTAHPRYVEVTNRWRAQPLANLSPNELLTGANEVLDAFANHLGSLMASTMGPSSGSETLFTNVYQKLVKKDGDPTAPTFLMGFDNAPLEADKKLYDLAAWCREQDSLAIYLTNTPTDDIIQQLENAVAPEGVDPTTWEDWQERFRQHLDQYGYSIYDMDFAKPLPMDEPAPLLEMLKLFIDGSGRNPYQRQREHEERRAQVEQMARSRLKGLKSWAFEKSLKWAQTQAPLREDGIAEVGLGYPVLHEILSELGRRFAEAGAIQKADDIYWLEEIEVKSLVASLESKETPQPLSTIVEERKAIWKAQKQATPPPQLPPGKKYMGFNLEGVLAGGEGSLEGDTFSGVATSPGQVTATARVLHGPEDFDQLQPGDILVAGITTPAWTPLFALASGVVTDIGGPLSHGSIVAREYGIPAVLGTGVATKVIQSGQTIAVDGSAGTVTILNGNAQKENI